MTISAEPTNDGTPKRVVVAVDGSDASERALAWAATEAELRAATLHVVHAWHLPATALSGSPVTSELGADVQRSAERIVDETMTKVFGTTGSHAFVRREVIEGQAIPVILRASEGADLLVLGTRGHGRVSGLFLGSVSQYATVHARCPVVVVHGTITPPNEPEPIADRVVQAESGPQVGTGRADQTGTGAEPFAQSGTGAEPFAQRDVSAAAALVELSETECLALLGSAEVGRIAVVRSDGRPEIVPVNFVVDGRTVAFRTDSAILVTSAPLGHVAFEVDAIDPIAREGWDVVVTGVANDITDTIDRWSEQVRSGDLTPWAPGAKERWIAIANPKITGRRLHQGRSEAATS